MTMSVLCQMDRPDRQISTPCPKEQISFEKSNFKGLSRFIAMIDQVLEAKHDLASVTVAPPKDAVELMSIHKSKGLEFPYVFILNIDQQFNKQDSMSDVILSRKKWSWS